MFGTGYIQDTPDSRDISLESKLSEFGDSVPPAEYAELAKLFDIHLEQSANSCVGFSMAEALYAAWRAQGIQSPQIASPLFLWWNSRKTHGNEGVNSGTHIRMCLRQGKRLGFCSNDVYKGTGGEDRRHFADKPPRAAFMAAFDQRMTDLEYYRIKGLGDARIDSWKRALSNDHPIIFGVPLERSFFGYIGKGYIDSPGTNADMAGGHAMCALGYDDVGVYGPQTWGKRWGRDGWFYITWEYITQWALDQWAIRAPQYFSEVA